MNYMISEDFLLLLIEHRIPFKRHKCVSELMNLIRKHKFIRKGPGPGVGPSPGWGPVRVGAHMGT